LAHSAHRKRQAEADREKRRARRLVCRKTNAPNWLPIELVANEPHEGLIIHILSIFLAGGPGWWLEKRKGKQWSTGSVLFGQLWPVDVVVEMRGGCAELDRQTHETDARDRRTSRAREREKLRDREKLRRRRKKEEEKREKQTSTFLIAVITRCCFCFYCC